MQIDRGSLQFNLFGIPIAISPFSWLILAMLGGGMDIKESGDLRGVLIFVVAGMVALLVHELGHALVGRTLGGEPYAIVIRGLGAATYSRPPAGKWPYFLMVLAGPLATLLPGLAAAFLFGIQLFHNPLDGIVFSFCIVLGFSPPDWTLISLANDYSSLSPFVTEIYLTTITVSVWWCIFNLLPILPMDGGHLFDTLCPNRRLVRRVSLALSALIVLWALSLGSIFMVMLFGYFGYLNFMSLRHGSVI